MTTYVLMPAHRAVLEMANEHLRSTGIPPERCVLVTNGRHPILPHESYAEHVLYDASPDLNISRWWNIGLARATSDAIFDEGIAKAEILFLNADCQISSKDVAILEYALRELDLSMVGPDHRNLYPDLELGEAVVNTRLEPIDHRKRVPGFCFMIPVMSTIRPDNRFRWWYSDDHIEWQARAEKGAAVIPGTTAHHPTHGGTLLNSTLQRYADEDLEKFIKEWGTVPCTS